MPLSVPSFSLTCSATTAALLIAIAFLSAITVAGEGWENAESEKLPHKRFEYKFSFKPPYLAQKDGTVPFFEYSGNAIASEESVRITPSLRSQKGMIWSKQPTSFDWWEVEIQFRVTGRGRVGADGLAFWYSLNKGFEGPVFGSSDQWNGLGVFFDSFDNDNKHNNPYIMAMVNDGLQSYDHQNDGTTQQLAGCLRDFRNKPFPVRAKIEYYKNVLTVHFHSGMSNNERDFELCIRKEGVTLPKSGFFGISAATGGLADDHDVLKFSTSSLRAPEMAQAPDAVNEAESKKFEQEFEEYQKKLKEQKDKWAEENPDQVKPDTDEWDSWFSEQDKELQQIFQGQSEMKNHLLELTRKMDDILRRQERTMSMIGGGNVAPSSGSGGGPVVDTIRRDEVNAVLANQREIVSASRDIKNFVQDIHQKTGQLMSRGSATPVGSGGVADYSGTLQELRDNLNHVRREMQSATAKLGQTVKCPDTGSVGGSGCVSTTVFVILMLVQAALIISYLVYRDSKETQAKKFY